VLDRIAVSPTEDDQAFLNGFDRFLEDPDGGDVWSMSAFASIEVAHNLLDLGVDLLLNGFFAIPLDLVDLGFFRQAIGPAQFAN